MKLDPTCALAALAAVFGGMALAQGTTMGAPKPLPSVRFSPDQDVNVLRQRSRPATRRSVIRPGS